MNCQSSRKTFWGRKFGLALMGLLIGIVLAEVSLRLVGISYPSFYVVDENVGYKLRPYAAGRYQEEGIARITVNGDGLRDREHTKVKPLDIFRIAILGDSYAEAKQVSVQDTFW
jgi:hypothetical protein